MDTSAGKKRWLIRLPAFTLWFIHNMVVVTSPIGDQAPPEFAAIMINPAYHFRKSGSVIIFLRILISTIVAVRLSINAGLY